MKHGTLTGYVRHKCRCKRCRRAQAKYKKDYRRRKDEDPAYREERLKRRRDRWLQKEYGITADEFDALVAAQDGKCPICLQEPESWHVDHCHDTGAVRGLLCGLCNSGLGHLGDNPERLSRGIMYLERNKSRWHARS